MARRSARNHETMADRLDLYAERDPNSGCWLWSGSPRSKARYPSTSYRGKFGTVHRHVFEDMVRPLEPGEVVCHRCDTSYCVNPAHLWAGSQRENMRDMAVKGRGRPRGRSTGDYSVRFSEPR